MTSKNCGDPKTLLDFRQKYVGVDLQQVAIRFNYFKLVLWTFLLV